ncbi:MAG: ABC transporter substrate-binding protein [Hyphomicrobiales bacterium]|nr:ABC transporter substrate-binding protein [Hyphomicrobiales bacterium]
MSSSRREFLMSSGALGLAGLLGGVAPFGRAAHAAGAIKVGLLLPASGTYAPLGEAIRRGAELYVKSKGGALAGRAIEFTALDDESAPPKAAELTNKLIFGEKVDVLMGTVHSGVAAAMVKIAREAGVTTLVPNAGADAITGGLCAPNVFRTSFANGQVGEATAKAMLAGGVKEAITCTWRYAAGEEMVAGFKRVFEAGGGKVVKDIALPFPDVEFQSALAEIAAAKPQAVYSFFAGGGAAKFIKDFAGAGLKDKVQLWGPGFLTDGVEQAVGAAGDGVKTVLHYADGLTNPEDAAFRKAFQAAYGVAPDVYAVQGWDAMHVLDVGLTAVGGDVAKKDALHAAMAGASFASPRGPFAFSANRNPKQTFYLRELKGGKNVLLGVAAEGLADVGKGCKA